MIQLAHTLFIILLLLMIYQDYKFRAISWVLFPILFSVALVINLFALSLSEVINNSVLNFSFLFFLLLMITVYFSLKYKALINVTNGLIGWGDVLFIACLCVLFSPVNFILFYLLSLLLILTGTLIYRLISKSNSERIPLAGLQALILLVLFVVNQLFSFFNFSDDSWIVYTIAG